MVRRGGILAASLALALAAPAAAQRGFGPGDPGAPAPALRVEPGTLPPPEALPLDSSGESWLNPVSVVAGAAEAISPRRGGEGAGTGLSAGLNVLLLLTVIALAPSIMLMTTCFVRIIIVLALLRQALGTNNLPPPQVVLALTLFMTAVVMGPTAERVHAEAVVPFQRGEVRGYDELWARASRPLRDFMFAQIEATGNWSGLYMMLDRHGVSVEDPSRLTRADVPTAALIPAYMLSELKTAFLMGFRVYLPFLVIDIVISSLLISMSMMMLPPVLISLPFKILLFVLVDGWQLVVGGLMSSFAPALGA